MKISTVFNLSKIQFNQENEVILMTSIKAPKVKTNTERAPLNLSLALDVSGSMMGLKLETVKKSVCKLVEQLSERDTVGIVTFGSYVQEVYSPAKMTAQNKANLIAEVSRLMTQGCTNMSGGMLKSFEQIKKADLDKGLVHRLLVFTDGQANEGLRTAEEFNKMVSEQNKNTPITVSCFGFGADHDAQMLSSIADTGKGNFYYINSVEDIAKTFARELGGLLTCYAQNVSIYLDMNEKYGEFVEVVNDLTCESPNKQRVKVTLDDVYSEETKHILVKVKLNKASKAVTQRPTSVVDVLVTFNDMADSGKFKEERNKAKIHFVKADDVQKEEALEVIEQLALIELGKAHEKARQFADSRDFFKAQQSYSISSAYAATLKSRGSDLADIVGCSITSSTDNLTAVNYSAAHAHTLTNASNGIKKMRAVDNATSMLYANSVQKDLEKSFTEDVDSTTADNAKDNISGSSINWNGLVHNGPFDLSNGTASGIVTINPSAPLTNTITLGTPYISNVTVDLTPNPSLAGKEVKKKDGLNKRRTV